MSDAPLKSTEGLSIGDVVQIAVQLIDKRTGQPFWWKRFACVQAIDTRYRFYALTLKLNVTSDDMRMVDMRDSRFVTTVLEPERWPQGVVAMRMKLIATRKIRLEAV